MHSKAQNLKKVYRNRPIERASERASECHSPHRIYNSLLRMRAIHELKMMSICSFASLLGGACGASSENPNMADFVKFERLY